MDERGKIIKSINRARFYFMQMCILHVMGLNSTQVSNNFFFAWPSFLCYLRVPAGLGSCYYKHTLYRKNIAWHACFLQGFHQLLLPAFLHFFCTLALNVAVSIWNCTTKEMKYYPQNVSMAEYKNNHEIHLKHESLSCLFSHAIYVPSFENVSSSPTSDKKIPPTVSKPG